MFWEPGHCYVYLIYGMHYCFNIVTEKRDFGAAVLVRALEPIDGVALMHKRRKQSDQRSLTNGPGKLCQALGIDKGFLGEHLLQSTKIRLERDVTYPASSIAVRTRIGISQATDLPWRFYVKNNPFVSRK